MLEVTLGSYSTDVEIGEGEGEGEWTMGEPIANAEATATVNACLAEHHFEYPQRLPDADRR